MAKSGSPLSTKPYKGTRDFYPEEMNVRNVIFDRLRRVVDRYGYAPYDGPMLEPFELYAAKTGEEIVNQQLYWLMDRGERKLAIRPEMTPTLARMVAARIQELPRPVRWYSIPNLWRYERPQRGRLREHWQLNVDVLGGDRTLGDAEILSVAVDLIRAFGGEKHIRIRVNNRRLMDHVFEKVLGLAPEGALGLIKALDERAKISEEAFQEKLDALGIQAGQRAEMEKFFEAASAQGGLEKIITAYDSEGARELQALFEALRASGVEAFVDFDPTVMRGMDYYTGTVFEIYDTSPENRRAMFGGGRYDDLLSLFGKEKLSGVGFGMGDVTLWNFLETHGLLPEVKHGPDVLVTLPDESLLGTHLKISHTLREAGISVVTPLGAGKFGAQLKQATKLQVRYVVLLGESELKEGNVAVKKLATGEQSTVPVSELVRWLETERDAQGN